MSFCLAALLYAAAVFGMIDALVPPSNLSERQQRWLGFTVCLLIIGLPGYVAVAFHHSWAMAFAIHGIATACFFLFMVFGNIAEAFVPGLILAVLLAVGSITLKDVRSKEARTHALREARLHKPPNQTLQRTASSSMPSASSSPPLSLGR